jgi:hypothetical protein
LGPSQSLAVVRDFGRFLHQPLEKGDSFTVLALLREKLDELPLSPDQAGAIIRPVGVGDQLLPDCHGVTEGSFGLLGAPGVFQG